MKTLATLSAMSNTMLTKGFVRPRFFGVNAVSFNAPLGCCFSPPFFPHQRILLPATLHLLTALMGPVFNSSTRPRHPTQLIGIGRLVTELQVIRKNPVHQYNSSGPYLVCLIVYDTAENCVADHCDSIYLNPIIAALHSTSMFN
jgi:hypothetical protein